jgi:hypothetical protein
VASPANVHFEDAHEGFIDTRGSAVLSLHHDMHDDSVSMNNFFKRPLRIREFSWLTNSNLNVDFNPWNAYFDNPRVINRLANFRLLRASLHVKFMLNGTSLHYGRLLISYRPLPGFDGLSRNNGGQNDLCLASQRMHLYLNPTISQGGTLELPFFHPSTFLDVTRAQWSEMGIIDCDSLTTLKHANGADSPVTLTVFAWAEDVEVCALTQQNPSAIVPQSMPEYKGIVSKPASHLSKFASMLKDIPVLSNMAMATEIGAGSIAYMANYFGFSRPAHMTPEYRVITSNDPIPNFDGPKALVKLTADSKQELTVDPAVAGLSSYDE